MASHLEQTLIVMPAFNEAETVGSVVGEVFSKLPGVAVLVVDDGSSDSTTEVAREAGALVMTLPFNLGVGGAMRAGFKFAEKRHFAYVVQIDSDGQHDPAYVPALIDLLSEADVAIGARFAGEGSYHVRGPRQWAMRALSFVLSRSTKTTLSDTTSGYRASGPRAISLFARHYPAEYLGDTIESLVIASRAGLTVRQLPVTMRVRQGGVPSQNFIRSTTYLARAVLALVFAFVRPSSRHGEPAS